MALSAQEEAEPGKEGSATLQSAKELQLRRYERASRRRLRAQQ
jgi:hypothetical protein